MQVFLLFGTKYDSQAVVEGETLRQHFTAFLELLRQRRRPFAFVYFHSQMPAFSSGPLPRIRHTMNTWSPSEQALLVQYDVIHPRWFTKLRDRVRRHPDPDITFNSYRTIVDFFLSVSDDPSIATRIMGALPKEILNLYLVEWNTSPIKTPLPGQEFKLSLPASHY